MKQELFSEKFMKITRKNLIKLISDVVLPFEQKLLDDDLMAKYIKDDEIKAKHNIAIAKLALEIIRDPIGAEDLFKEGAKAHNDLDISKDDMQKYLSIFFNLHRQWCIKNFIIDKDHYEKLISKFDAIFMKSYKPNSDTFLMFDSEEIDEAIESMHHAENKKITALEYLKYDEILEDDLYTIVELKDECEHLLNMHEVISYEYFCDFDKVIQTLSGVLFATYEFKDVGYSLRNLSLEMNTIEIDNLEASQKELIFTLLFQMSEDIQNWVETIFIKKDAVDIHYFDASFLANIAQFSIMLKQNVSNNSESKDDFLF